MYYKYKKVCRKSLAVRAGSVRPRGLAGSIKKVCTCCRPSLLPDGADGRSAAYKTKKKGAKKRQKRGLAGQNLRLSRSARFRRPECGGGVCQLGGWLVYAFYAGSIPGAA